MVDFSQIRKELLKAEASGEGDDSEDESSVLAGMATIVPGWKRELDDFYTAAPLSIGAGLLFALGFDAVKNRGSENGYIFTDTWKSLAMISGSLLFGYGAGRLSRGKVAQSEAEYYQDVIKKAEEEFEAEKEEKEAEEKKQQSQTQNILRNPDKFQLSPSYPSLNVLGEYGPAIGQSQLSYKFMG